MNDQTGPTGFTGVYARIGAVISGDPEYSGLAIALSGGLVQYRVNSDEFNLRDPNDVVGMNSQTELFPDVGAGIYFYQMLSGAMDGDMFYAGVSVPQVAGIDLTFKNDNGEFAVQRIQHFYGMVGLYHFFRNDGFLEPSLWIKYVDGAPINADLNLRYQTPNSIWIGTGISSAGNFHFEAGFNLGENVGLYNNVKIGYGYDYSFSSFGPSVGNTHELQAGNGGNLGPALFDGTVPGIISFGVWETGDCGDPANIGVTLDDDVDVLFELCFEAIGDQVCVDFTVEGFDGLNGIQFTVNYDDSFLSFVNLFPNTEIPANTLGAYGLPGVGAVDPGEITVAWSYTITDPPNVSVADGTTMFTACFDILGACETSTEITFSGDPTPIEANNDDPDNPTESSVVPMTLVPGAVAVNDCDPEGIEIKIDCGDPVNLGDIVCVEFQAGSNFDAVRRLEYLMTWNPNILEFQSVDDPNNLSGLSFPGNFDTSNISNGVLGLDWEFIAGPPQNMDNMELIYRVCFEVVGVGGDSPIQIITPGIGVSNGVNIGINPTNCVVQVNQPESVVVDFGNIAAPLGGSDCVPVTVSNFTNVLSTQFTMNWDESIWLHNGTIQNENPALAGATVTYTPVGLASMGFQMDNGTDPITLTDGSVLFEICFDTAPTANPGECDELTTVGLPFAESAITSTSNGDNIGLIVNPGDLCILFPEGFGMTAVSTSGGWLDTVCMDFTVESFDNITAADFNINWDPAALQFVSSSTLAWNDLTLTSQPVGTLNGTFTSGTPVAIPDGEVAFQVCFLVIGDPNECYPVTIQDSPAPEVQTSNGQGSMVITNGEICSEERIVITDLDVVPPSCPGACDGQISITVASWEGQGFIGTTWTTENPEFQQFTPLMLDDVCEGMTIYRIFDNNSGVFLQDTLFIESDGVVPNAVIEDETELPEVEITTDDLEINCFPDSQEAVIRTTAMVDGDLVVQWYRDSISVASEIMGANGDTLTVANAGIYIIQVSNPGTGCAASDTTEVIGQFETPTLTLDMLTPTVNCDNPTVTVTGTVTNSTDFTVGEWMSPDGGNIVAITNGGLTVEVDAMGTYVLIVTSNVSGCTTEQDFVVSEDFAEPTVNVTSDMLTLDCTNNEQVTLDGTGSSVGQDFTYLWENQDGAGPDNPTIPVTIDASATGDPMDFSSIEWTGGDFTEVVTVTFEFPDDANAGADAAACDDIFDLSGNLPTNGDNITGVWTTATGAVIDMPNSPVTMVSGLQEGANSFVWTLSATGCPEFSSDEVIITSAAAPVANEDFLDIEADELGGEVSLIANDLFGGSTNFDLTILEGPIFGTYDTAALDLGTFVLNLMPSEFGTSIVTYQLCSTDCPDLCDTSTLTITVAQSENPFVPNTVTPNGDGANDDLVFDIITFSDPDDIPDNELIIFNRWGDIIYEAKPYTNNWNGLNQDGQPVPEGTYYYVLRLNISRGEIIRGDITVIR
eukprot:g725.t1